MINKQFYEQNTQGREKIFDDKQYKRGAAVCERLFDEKGKL